MRCAWLVLLGACAVPEGRDPVPDADPRADDASTAPGDSDAPDTPGGTGDTASTNVPDPGLPLPAASWGSGSRLQVETWRVAGVEAFARFFDRELGLPCSVELAEDGVLRCLPLSAQALERFADAACTSRVFVVGADACARAPYLRVGAPDTTTCGPPERFAVFPLREIDAPAAVYRVFPECEADDPVPGGATVYALQPLLDPPLAPSTFVGFTPEVRFGTAGAGVAMLTADDGAWLVRGLADPGGRCSPLRLDGALRCVPDERAVRAGTQAFAGADCLTAPLARDEREDECPATRVVASQHPFTGKWTVWSAGSRWPGEVYVASSTCRVVSNDGLWVEQGAELDPTAFPEVQAGTEGAGDVRLRVWQDTTGARLLVDPTLPFHHVPSDTPCRPVPTSDGTWVCLPADAVDLLIEESWYADEACTEPVFSLGAAPPDLAYVRGRQACAVEDDAPDLVVQQAWRFGAVFRGTLHVRAGAACLPALTTPAGTTWRRGEKVSPSAVYPVLELAPR